MNKNSEIANLAEEIMLDITNNRIPLSNICLKASRLSLLLDIPVNINLFAEWAKYAEENQFLIDTFQVNIQSSTSGGYSSIERGGLRSAALQRVQYMSNYRTQTYTFAMNIYTRYKFGNIVENIFEKKRKKVEPILAEVFPDMNQKLNSIEKNLNSDNPEDWKNSVASCRTVIMEIADILNPAKIKEEKSSYINRLKDYISEKVESTTKRKLTVEILEELKTRIELTTDLTQGGAHKDKVELNRAEDVVLYTYLILAELMEIYSSRKVTTNEVEQVTQPSNVPASATS